jgi:hypothetical protein
MWRLAWREVWAAPGRSLLAALGIAVGATFVFLTVGFGLSLRAVVSRRVLSALPMGMVEVVPRTVDLGLFKTPSLFGPSELDGAALSRLRALPGVAAAYPKLEVSLPLGARGGEQLFGRPLYAELFMVGLPPELVPLPEFVDGAGHVPVVVSEQLLDVYNASVARAMGTVQLGRDSLNGFEFEITVGRSLMLGERGARSTGTERGRIVGFSPYATRLGVAVPLRTAQRLMRDYGEGRPESYASVLLRVTHLEELDAVTGAALALGFDVDDTAKQAAEVSTLAIAAAALLAGLVLAVAGLSIMHLFAALVSERQRELAIMGALGLDGSGIFTILLAQATILGALGGVAALAAGQLVARVLDAAASVMFADFPFRPDPLFVLPLWLHLAVFAASVACSSMGAAAPSYRVARIPLAQLLAEV